MGINLADIYDTMQVNLGRSLRQRLHLFWHPSGRGRPMRHPADAAAITNLQTRNGAGEMVPQAH
jgi:multidrug efflux pump